MNSDLSINSYFYRTFEKWPINLRFGPRKEERHRSRDGLSSEPGRDGEHSSASILQFNSLATVIDSDLQRVPSQVSGKASRLKSRSDSFVVRNLTTNVGHFVDFDNSAEGEHLQPRFGRKRFHGVNRAHSGKIGELDFLCDGKVFVNGDFVESQSELVEGVSNGGDHSGSSVLEFGRSDELSGLFRSPFHGELIPNIFSEEDSRERRLPIEWYLHRSSRGRGFLDNGFLNGNFFSSFFGHAQDIASEVVGVGGEGRSTCGQCKE